jgi:hypothetical protein
MTRATLATRTAAGLSAALISAMSLVACGGGEDSSTDEPVEEETTEAVDDPADDSVADEDESAQRRDRDRSATRDERRDDRPGRRKEPATDQTVSTSEGPGAMSPSRFCDRYQRYETKGVFAEADTPAGAQRAADRLEELALRTPPAIRDDIELMARLFGEIAEANGDQDKLAEIDASELPATQKHLERWQKKHC